MDRRRRDIRVTNLDKVLFPGRDGDDPVTKRDLFRYAARSPRPCVPFLDGRGLTVQRYPNGIEQKGFWQKDLPKHAPDWVKRWTYHHREEGPKDYPVVDSARDPGVACPGGSHRAPPLDQPDRCARPTHIRPHRHRPGPDTTWEELLTLARLYRAALQHLGVRGHPKVTGKRGIQVWIGIRRGPTFDETRDWVEALSRAVGSTVPDLVSWEWASARAAERLAWTSPRTRSTRPWSPPTAPRPAPGAPVSMPIRWEELDDPDLRPDRWTIRNALDRVSVASEEFAAALTDDQVLPPID